MRNDVNSIIEEADIPSASVLDRRFIESAYFFDSYRAPLTRPHAGIFDIFHAIFAHHPIGMKIALIIRNRIVSCFGLDAPTTSKILNPEFKSNYAVGEKIGVWPIFSMTETELVVGHDDKHLDFRLSLLKVTDGETASVVVSTICVVHNVFGKVYLFFIVPFHKWGVKKLISSAIAAGRL
ncbi:MAG: hypothetical protein A3I66_19325 [Burkholderiales bacterium RIFCSPLOWO2_02_FULL_57_36]|nr:MAG: hypothetical protein A3I66_19325 [Burkholderiales bacterium RIFCSPLOWO2_02_FULL_57_36]